MATSTWLGTVAAPATVYGLGDDPVGTVIERDTLHNNLSHACDSMAQVRVNFFHPNGLTGGHDLSSTQDGPGEFPYSGRVIGTFGDWPITVGENSQPYSLRVEAYGDSASAAGVAFLWVVIAPSRSAAGERWQPADHIWRSDALTTTAAKLTGSTMGSGAYSDRIVLSPDLVRTWAVDTPVFDDYSSGSPRSVQQVMVSATVFGSQSNAASLVRLYGLHISEFIAP